ncbi:hypothetical protein THAOC_35894, partial [Thalassiosira oceanica]
MQQPVTRNPAYPAVAFPPPPVRGRSDGADGPYHTSSRRYYGAPTPPPSGGGASSGLDGKLTSPASRSPLRGRAGGRDPDVPPPAEARVLAVGGVGGGTRGPRRGVRRGERRAGVLRALPVDAAGGRRRRAAGGREEEDGESGPPGAGRGRRRAGRAGLPDPRRGEAGEGGGDVGWTEAEKGRQYGAGGPRFGPRGLGGRRELGDQDPQPEASPGDGGGRRLGGAVRAAERLPVAAGAALDAPDGGGGGEGKDARPAGAAGGLPGPAPPRPDSDRADPARRGGALPPAPLVVPAPGVLRQERLHPPQSRRPRGLRPDPALLLRDRLAPRERLVPPPLPGGTGVRVRRGGDMLRRHAVRREAVSVVFVFSSGRRGRDRAEARADEGRDPPRRRGSVVRRRRVPPRRHRRRPPANFGAGRAPRQAGQEKEAGARAPAALEGVPVRARGARRGETRRRGGGARPRGGVRRAGPYVRVERGVRRGRGGGRRRRRPRRDTHRGE